MWNTGHSARPHIRKHCTYLGRVCVSTKMPVTMRRVTGFGCRRIFPPHFTRWAIGRPRTRMIGTMGRAGSPAVSVFQALMQEYKVNA
jgi:hypothetical protein